MAERAQLERRQPFAPGSFSIGCNYWASHAGIRMWREWDSEVVRADLDLLASSGLQMLRIFPLWPDFQPVVALYTGGGRVRGHTAATAANPLEKLLRPGDDGVDQLMLDRLEELTEIAAAAQLRLVVALITGWMSGRLFVPAAVSGRNLLRDADAIRWQAKLVRAIVGRLRKCDAVVAWDLGNECNVMGKVEAAESWVWTSTMTGAIRSVDPSRPVVSGMHGLATDSGRPWSIAEQSELTDVLTTHPYPLFTPHCAREPLVSFRPILHPAAETRLYSDLGGVPAFAEETGSLGPSVSGDVEAAEFAFAAAMSLWVYDCRALLWWCAFDFDHLGYPPYEWDPVERELGLFSRDRVPKPVVEALKRARKTLSRISGGKLPPRVVDAVCVLPAQGEWWGTAYTVFLLALQAGFDVRFVSDGDPLPSASMYLLPSIRFAYPHSRSTWTGLLSSVAKGATLYLSLDDGIVTELSRVFGVRVKGRFERSSPDHRGFEWSGSPERFDTQGATGFALEAGGAAVLGRMRNGDPAFTRNRYGAGTAFLLGFPLESEAAETALFFERPGSRELWRVYAALRDCSRTHRVIGKSSPSLGVTEHPRNPVERIAMLINYTGEPIIERVSIAPGWTVDGPPDLTDADRPENGVKVRIEAFDIAALRLRKVDDDTRPPRREE